MTTGINSQGGHRPMLGGPPNYRPNRSQDWPDLPDTLVICGRCEEHAALYGSDETGYYCGMCAPRVSIFCLAVYPDSAIQTRADRALFA